MTRGREARLRSLTHKGLTMKSMSFLAAILFALLQSAAASATEASVINHSLVNPCQCPPPLFLEYGTWLCPFEITHCAMTLCSSCVASRCKPFCVPDWHCLLKEKAECQLQVAPEDASKPSDPFIPARSPWPGSQGKFKSR